MKGSLRFKQLRLNYINNNNNKKKKPHLKLLISSIRVGVFAKTNDEVYVLITIKIYRHHHAKMVEKKIIHFSVSPYYTPLFSRRKTSFLK